MLQELIDTFEFLKSFVFIIDRGQKGRIIIKFNDSHFYHLIGLHKINFDIFLPNYIKARDKQYKYIKKNVDKYDNILTNQIAKKDTLKYRINTFHNLPDLLQGNNTTLYNLKQKVPGSLYDGDYGILKIYETLYCLLGLKEFGKNESDIYCAPQSWMANNRENSITKYKIPIYMNKIEAIPLEQFDKKYCYEK